MKKIILFVLLGLGLMTSQAQTFIVNDANAVARPLPDFNAVEVSNAIDLYLVQSNESAVAVSAKEIKYRDKIITQVKDGVLQISYDNGGGSWNSGDRKLKAYVSIRELRSIKASGASDVVVNGVIKANELSLTFSGASDYKGRLEANKLFLEVSGASDVQLEGKANELVAKVSGASDVDAYKLETSSCDVSASGASSFKITVQERFTAQASGSSDVYFKGAASKTTINSSGSSSIVRKDK
jgi:hypothetical protein